MTPEDVATVRRVVLSVWLAERGSLLDDDLAEVESRVLLAIVEVEHGIRELGAYAYVVARRAVRAMRQERVREAETLAVVQFSAQRPGIDHLPPHVEVPSERSKWGGRRRGAGRPKLRVIGE